MGGRNSFGVSMSGLSQFFESSFELFAGCLLDATIPDEEFEREKRLQIEQIRSRRDQLGAVSFEQFYQAFFAPHPYSMLTVGTEESVSNLRVEDVRAYYKALVRPSDLVLVVVGDIDAELVQQLSERYFSGRETLEGMRPEIPQAPELTEARLVVGDLQKEQAHLIVGFKAPKLGDEEQDALSVLNAVLSGQGGRLFYELRDRQSLAYSVGARMIVGLDVSAFVVVIGTSPEKLEQAYAGIINEVQKLRDGTITEEEVGRAKRYLAGSHDIGLQTNASRAISVGLDELYELGYKRGLEYGERIGAVSLQQVQDVVDKYLNPDKMLVSIIKPKETEISADFLTQLTAAEQGGASGHGKDIKREKPSSLKMPAFLVFARPSAVIWLKRPEPGAPEASQFALRYPRSCADNPASRDNRSGLAHRRRALRGHEAFPEDRRRARPQNLPA